MSHLTGPMRVGVVGLGYGAHVLVPAFLQDPRCCVSVVTGRREDKAAAAALKWGVGRWSTDWRATATTPDIDVLVVAVPPAAQPEIVITGLRAGKHVFCEKPLAVHVSDAELMAQAAILAGRAHAVDFELTEVDAFQQAKVALTVGRIGAVRHASITWHVETRANRDRLLSWKLDAAAGGGTLNAFGSHVLHYVEWLLGPIASMSAHMFPNASADVLAWIWARLESGVPVSVTMSADAPRASGHRIEIYGDEGALILENPWPDYARFSLTTRLRTGEEERVDPTFGPDDGRIQAAGRLVQRFLSSALGGAMCRPGFEDGLRVQRLLDDAKRAAAIGGWIEVRH